MPLRTIAPDRTGLHWFDRFKRSIEDLLNSLDTKATQTAAYQAKSADYTLTTADYLVSFDCTAAARTATLPPAASVPGRILSVKKIDASGNSLTLDGDGTETIDGATTKATTTQYAGFTVISTGSAWLIIP